MTNIFTRPRSANISAPAVLLFMALAAQAPHAMAVFVRVAPHTAPWEVYVSIFGGLVYAVALEGATAFFVWRSQLRWAIAFAVFSVLHNVAYYLPAAWTVTAWGATLLWRDVVGSVLISISLPIAIAAFSHVQAQQRAAQLTWDDARPVAPAAPALHETPAAQHLAHDATPDDAPAQPDKRTQAMQLRDEGYTPAEITRMLNAKYSTVQSWLRRAQVQQNGANHD